MEFKKIFSRSILIASLLGILIIGIILWQFLFKTNPIIPEGDETMPQEDSIKEVPIKQTTQDLVALSRNTAEIFQEDDSAIQEQLDHDRQQQKQTRYLKTKLEQTNLELEEEKALAEINKIKKENVGAFNEPAVDGPKNMPEIKVDYIGGDSVKKEAILSIAGASYQVKEKSSPTDNIQVMSISDSGVTLHFTTPEELTKTFDYKPE